MTNSRIAYLSFDEPTILFGLLVALSSAGKHVLLTRISKAVRRVERFLSIDIGLSRLFAPTTTEDVRTAVHLIQNLI